MGEHKDHMTKALHELQDRGEIMGMPKEPPEGFSKNRRAEELLGLRRTDCTAFDQPCELGYHCPLCEYPHISKDGNYDERLHWSEYESMIWCSVCNVDYPSCLCLPAGSARAIEVFLASVGGAVERKPRKVTYQTWEEIHRENMKNPRYLFWWLVLAPKYRLIRLWMWIGRRWELLPTVGEAGTEESQDGR